MFLFQEFGRATANLKFESFDGGRDSRERMTQGLVVALRTAAPRTLIVVFTDNGTKDLRLSLDHFLASRDSLEMMLFL